MRQIRMLLLILLFEPVATPAAEPYSEHVLFYIAKSNNRNRVEYAARVDRACRFDPQLPITVYWRRLEQGPDVTRSLKWVEQRFAYGVDIRQQDEHEVEFSIAADPSRPVTVTAVPAAGGTCRVEAWLYSLGTTARTDHAFVRLKPRKLMFPKIYWVDLHTTLPDGQGRCERVTHRGEAGIPCPEPLLRAPAPEMD